MSRPRLRIVAAFSVLGSLLVCAACSSSSSTSEPAPAEPDAAVDARPAEVDDSDLIPCAPRRVLQAVCQECHSNPLESGAPFPLVTWSNVVTTNLGRRVDELMIQQLETRRMPLAPVTIDDDSRTVLLDWLRGGAIALDEPSGCTGDAGE